MPGEGYETPHDRNVRGLRALSDALGPVGMARFLQYYERGQGDYTSQRHMLLEGATMGSVRKSISEDKN